MLLRPLLKHINWTNEFVDELRQFHEDSLTAFMAGVLVLTEPDNDLILDSELVRILKSEINLTGYENINVTRPLTIMQFSVPHCDPWMKIVFSRDGTSDLVLLNVIGKPDSGSPQEIIHEAIQRYINYRTLFT